MYDVMEAVRSDVDEWETQILTQLKDIPIYELSRATGIDQGNLTLYLSGKRRPIEENIKKIKQGLLMTRGCDEWVDKILPRLKKMPTREAARIQAQCLKHEVFLPIWHTHLVERRDERQDYAPRLPFLMKHKTTDMILGRQRSRADCDYMFSFYK